MPMSLSEEIAACAASLVVDEGLEYAAAKKRAARDLCTSGASGTRARDLPSNEMLEDAVREHIALFHADTQPGELRALRELARTWMQRLAEFRPHLGGAVWRGTATRLSSVHLDLYCDDTKAAEFALINAGVDYDSAAIERPGADPLVVLSFASTSKVLGERVTVHLLVHDLDEQRGALKPDARGRSWRGALPALEQLLDAGA